MPSTKKYNEEKKKWQKFGSTNAVDINLIDFESNYQSDNVEGALREASSRLSDMKSLVDAQNEAIKDHTAQIEWLLEHGGGGGGTGGVAPTIESTFVDGTIVDKGTNVVIPIFFASPNYGEGIAYITINGIEVAQIEGIKQGNNKIDIGVLTELNNEVSIYVKDRVNALSNQLTWNIICGGIDLTIDFDSTADYYVTDQIIMQYNVVSASQEPIIMHLTIDYDEYEITCNKGFNEYEFKNLPVGIHKINLYVTSGPYKTPTERFNIVVVSSNELYISTTFEDNTQFEYGTPIPIDYRISKASTEEFTIELLLNGRVEKTLTAPPGSYFWTLNGIDLGAHTFTIRIISQYNEVKELIGSFEVIEGDFTPIKVSTAGLVYRLNAEGRTNNDSDKENPKDNSGNGINATLHNFNFYSNGWIDDTLVCDGTSYVEIDAYPWIDNALYGSTIEIQCKAIDIGLTDSRIFDYTDVNTPYKGAYVDIEDVALKSAANEGIVYNDTEQWMTYSFVIDRKNKFGKVFINGICSRAFFLSDTGSGTSAKREDFSHNQKIYLNSRKGQDKFGTCEIKDLRIYNRVLSDNEIVQNYIAQEKDLRKQKELYNFNYDNKTLPVIRMYGDMTNMTLETPVEMRIKYTSPNEDKFGQSFDLPYCQVNWQGTSSLQYVLKNFTARLKDENMAEYMYTPYENSIKESVFCFKAD